MFQPTKTRVTTRFIRSLSRTAIGAKPRITDMFSNHGRRKVRESGVLTRTGAGSTPMQVGHGSPKNRLAGRLITTVAGRVCATSAGCGCRVMNGRRRGFPGARAMTTWAGRRSRPRRRSIAAPAFISGPIIIMISGRKNTRLFQRMNSVRSASSKPSCRRNATS
jgi:hypothetical protein